MSPRSKEANEQIRAQSRAQILAAARRLFVERGYFNCKVSDIAQEAGMSQGNVYWYFEGKEAVLQAVLEDGFTAVEGVASEAAASPGTGQEKLNHLIDGYLSLYETQGDFMALLLSLLSQGGESFMQDLGFDMRQIGFRLHQHLIAIFAQAQAEGTVIATVDPNTLTMFFYALFNGLMVTYGDDWATLPHDQIRGAILRLCGSKAIS